MADNRTVPGDSTPGLSPAAAAARRVTVPHRPPSEAAIGVPRNFLQNRFVYCLISQRGRGLSIGVNLNPDIHCNFDCVYCEVDRRRPVTDRTVDIPVMIAELERMLSLANTGRIADLPPYRQTPVELLALKEVALSGDGEPTLSPQFAEIVRAIIHLRARGIVPFFKLVLVTNTTGLDRPEVQTGLDVLTATDEIWAKLDAGTQEYMRRINQGDVPIGKVLDNILAISRRRPVIIQSLFAMLPGEEEPPAEEIEQYALRLKELRERGANIPLVQVYSAHRPAVRSACAHLPLRSLSRIAQRVREVAGLKAEVF
jgi:wyosine [tRNA(Phe)-imidazoG37] synthetase (radical SAM superfamily)